MLYIIVGLGNPGEEYTNTRHNMGRILLEFFAKVNEFSEFSPDKKTNALISKGKVGKNTIVLLEPEKFMNNSGVSIKPLVTSVKLASKLIVVHDDLDIPFGKFKISFNRSSGGHRGVESIIKVIKTEGFIRVRAGISATNAKGEVKKPHDDGAVNKFILGKFKPTEIDELKKISKKVSEALSMIIESGYGPAMGKWNGA